MANYPADPTQIVPLAPSGLDTPLTVLGHEAGHLFLAYASVPDPTNPSENPCLASAAPTGASSSIPKPRWMKANRSRISTPPLPALPHHRHHPGYSPLDRYLMGFGPACDVPPTFYVKGYNPIFVSPLNHPVKGVTFDGIPVPVTTDGITQALGRRTPDYSVSQHRFRFAFILIVAAGSPDSALTSSVQQVETYRQQFPAAYAKVTANRRSPKPR